MRTVFSFSVGSPRRKGRRQWIHLAKVFRCAAMRAMVRSEKRRLPSASSSLWRASRNARDRRLVHSERVVTPLLRLHEGEEAPEVAALHRPGALGGRHLDGKVGLQPAGEGVGAALREIEAHRQAGLPRSGAGSPSRISRYNSFV